MKLNVTTFKENWRILWGLTISRQVVKAKVNQSPRSRDQTQCKSFISTKQWNIALKLNHNLGKDNDYTFFNSCNILSRLHPKMLQIKYLVVSNTRNLFQCRSLMRIKWYILVIFLRHVKTSSIHSLSVNFSETTSVVSFSNIEAGYKKSRQQRSTLTLSRSISTLSSRKEDLTRQEGQFQVTLRFAKRSGSLCLCGSLLANLVNSNYGKHPYRINF